MLLTAEVDTDSGRTQSRKIPPHPPRGLTRCAASRSPGPWGRLGRVLPAPWPLAMLPRDTHQRCGCGSGAGSSGDPVPAKPLRSCSWGRRSPAGLSPSILEGPSWTME